MGVLVGLAIYNATLLDLHFPLAIYRKLLSQPTSLADLEDIDPELMHGTTRHRKRDLSDENEYDIGREFRCGAAGGYATRGRGERKPNGKDCDVLLCGGCAGLKKLLEHDEEATGGSVQDVFCLSFEVHRHIASVLLGLGLGYIGHILPLLFYLRIPL